MLADSWDDHVEILLASDIIVDDYLKHITVNDTMLVLGSIAFVFFYLWLHLDSFFLAAVGIFLIIFSFPITALIT